MESTGGIGEILNQIDLDDYRNSNDEFEQLCDRCSGVRSIGPCSGKEKGKCCCNSNGLPSPLCVYYSPRIMGLLNGEKTEFETARDHWTVLDPGSEAEAEMIAEENRRYFDEVLAKHPEWGGFFTKYQHLELGEKIGEGAQAEVFAVSSSSRGVYPSSTVYSEPVLVAKVWKAGVPLKHLERQWPPQMLSQLSQESVVWPFKNICGGVFIREGEFTNRFAFVMERFRTDLRSEIDYIMLELLKKKIHGPPLVPDEYISMLRTVAVDLVDLHDAGVVHRDIKASNVLLGSYNSSVRFATSFVIDYECSVGVVGTGFWRAPEILDQLQKGVRSDKLVFTKEVDMYSFGMLCYEVITGCIPFDGRPQNDYSIVLSGGRPHLPEDIDPVFKILHSGMLAP